MLRLSWHVNLTQLKETIHNIYKIWGSNHPGHQKKINDTTLKESIYVLIFKNTCNLSSHDRFEEEKKNIKSLKKSLTLQWNFLKHDQLCSSPMNVRVFVFVSVRVVLTQFIKSRSGKVILHTYSSNDK